MPSTAFCDSQLPWPKRQGKVRDVYDLGQELLIVSTDRISAFDWILPSGIPDKGRVLTALSLFWFERLDVSHHLLGVDWPEVPAGQPPISPEQQADLQGRTMRTRKASVVPFECVVRGYLEGSGWKEYQETGSVCGIALPPGLKQCDRLPEPIFTPATKAESGHDENVSFETMANAIGLETATRLRDLTLLVFQRGSQWAEACGIIIADTKLEWGWCDGQLILIDEVLTPDSSRFWPSDRYQPGKSQPSFDKQYVREWLMASGWDRNSPPPRLPEEVIQQTRQRYVDAYELLTAQA
ncbi:MAG: phosphoribosylaminoimidazolesuccinocarboxamide synthase [Pirellulaceae bacterium]|nr:phosphoribosylaminoimidazolesuccinocarboxamide synthase [Pirellulaceae bacterium]